MLRVALQTEQEMHQAWRKRAEQAEAELTALRAPLPCGHPGACWVDIRCHPSIPATMKNPIVFMDANMGVCCVAEWPVRQWVFKIVNGRWMSVRTVDSRDPFLVDPLPESYCQQCRDIAGLEETIRQWKAEVETLKTFQLTHDAARDKPLRELVAAWRDISPINASDGSESFAGKMAQACANSLESILDGRG